MKLRNNQVWGFHANLCSFLINALLHGQFNWDHVNLFPKCLHWLSYLIKIYVYRTTQCLFFPTFYLFFPCLLDNFCYWPLCRWLYLVSRRINVINQLTASLGLISLVVLRKVRFVFFVIKLFHGWRDLIAIYLRFHHLDIQFLNLYKSFYFRISNLIVMYRLSEFRTFFAEELAYIMQVCFQLSRKLLKCSSVEVWLR